MLKLVPFVGRQSELDVVMRQLQRWGQTSAVIIDGEGGIGKSRLLQEVIRHCASEPRVCALPIKDLRDPRLRITNGMEFAIANDIGMDRFTSYQQVLTDVARMQDARESHDTVRQELSRAFDQFVESYNAFAGEVRVLIPLDTLESIGDPLARDYLINLASLLHNTLFLFAGRDATPFSEVAAERLGANSIQLLHLGPFEADDARTFFAEELSYRRIKLSDEVRDRIIVLSGGKAILIDLAVERVARTSSQQWMRQEPPEALGALTEMEQAHVRQAFERDLVLYFANLGTHEEQLKVFMGHVHWVDASLAARLLRVDGAEAQDLIDRMRSLTHIKEYPSGLVSPGPRISLHDELARLIREYVYREIDEDCALRREKSAIAAEYLGEQIQALEESADDIQQDITEGRQAGRVAREMQLTIQREESLQEYWKTGQEYLYHALYAEAETGAKAFLGLFDEASRQYRFHERDAIVEGMLPYFQGVDILSPQMRYDVGIRIVQHQIDQGEIQNTRETLEGLLGLYNDDIPRSVELHRLMGNVLVRSGEVDKGLKSFQRAVELSEQQTDLTLQARAENAAGWAFRLISYWKQACDHYRKAYMISLQIGDEPLQATILNNLGFAHSYFNRREAVDYCSTALEIWTDLDDQRGIGMANSTLGNLYYQMNEPQKALEYFGRALAIFEPRRDREFLARVYSWLGATHYIMDDLNHAEECLRLSLEQGVRETEAQVLNRLARVYRRRGDLDMATTLVQRSYEISQQICDVLYEFASLRDLISFAVERRQYHRYGEFAGLVNRFEERWPAPDTHTHGSTYLYLALLVLGQRRRDIALPKYLLRRAFELIVEAGQYADASPKMYLERADGFLRSEARSGVLQDIGTDLWNHFKDRVDPGALLTLGYFNRWRRIDGE